MAGTHDGEQADLASSSQKSMSRRAQLKHFIFDVSLYLFSNFIFFLIMHVSIGGCVSTWVPGQAEEVGSPWA